MNKDGFFKHRVFLQMKFKSYFLNLMERSTFSGNELLKIPP
jgi:hypothetical protein